MSAEAIVFFDLLKRPISKDELKVFASPVFKSGKRMPRPILFKGLEYFSFFDVYTSRNLLRESCEYNHIAWRKVAKYSWIFRCIPFIKMVAVCNTLAFDSSKKGSDIDFFVITKHGRMFTARLLLTAMCHLLGVRRHGGKIAQRFCLSFFVSEESLSLSPILLKPLDVYMVFWMRSLKVLFGANVFDGFVKENSWYKKYYSDVPVAHFKHLQKKCWIDLIGKLLERVLNGKFGDFLETKLQKWQLERAGLKRDLLSNSSGTVISSTMLKFHDNDRRDEFLSRWEATCSS